MRLSLLPSLVNNNRFPLLPWIKVRNLASRVLIFELETLEGGLAVPVRSRALYGGNLSLITIGSMRPVTLPRTGLFLELPEGSTDKVRDSFSMATKMVSMSRL